MTTYYVSTSGNNGNSGTSTGAAWRTIQYACEQVSAGDTIRVMSGTYAENVIIAQAETKDSTGATIANACNQGTSSAAQITLMSHDSSNPGIISGSSVRNQMKIANRSHWVIDGIKFANYKSGGLWVRADSQDVVGVIVQNCIFDSQSVEAGGTSGMLHVCVFDGNSPYSVNYSYILNNQVGDVKTGTSTATKPNAYNECISCHHNCHHILIQGNTVLSSSYLTFDVISKSGVNGTGLCEYIIFDQNTVRSCKSSYYGTNNAFKIDGGDYIVFQNNKSLDADFGVNGVEPWSDAYKNEYKYHLWRNNVADARGYAWQNWGILIGGNRYTGSSGDIGIMANSYIVHNCIIVEWNGQYPAYCIQWEVQKRLRLKNNVFWHAGGSYIMLYNSYARTTYPNSMKADNWELAGNLYYGATGAYFQWVDGTTYTTWTSYQTAREPSSQWGKPVLESDYQLSASSPGYQDGVALTVAVGNGSSVTTLYVRDAGYFIDGFGLIDGDTIYVGGTEATIDSIDYSSNKITLAAAISWDDGDAVGYATTPSIGILSNAGSSGVIVADPVTAYAGPNQTVYDNDSDGRVTVTLDGSGSSADADIATYGWAGANLAISSVAKPTVTLPLGTFEFTLTVTDVDGNSDTDTVTITVRGKNDISVGQPLVKNPCLQNGDNWLMYSTGTTTWTPVSGGGYEIEVTSAGGNTQLSQEGVSIDQGATYTLRLVATADTTPQTLAVSLFKNTSPFTNYGLNYQASIGTTQTVVEYEFVSLYTANDARLMIFFDTGEHVTINEFNLLRAGESGCYNENYTGVVTSGSLSVTSTDDYFSEAGGQFYENGNPTYAGDYRALYNNYDQFTGWIFVTDTAIPNGAEITSATLKVTAGGYSGALPKLRVDIENAADPSKPSSASDAAGRTWITGSAWQAVAWTNTVQYTIDIDADVVQSLINTQDGISNGANIHLRLTDADVGFQAERLAVITTAAAELDIAWDAPAAGGTYAEEINPLRPGIRVGLKQGF